MSKLEPGARRRLVASTTLGAAALLALALLVIVNYFGGKYFKRFDWTSSRLYTLSEKTENVLAGLDRDFDTVVFMTPGEPLYDPVRELLSRYEAASPRIKVRIVDPDKNPAEAQSLVDRYELTQLNVVVFDSGADRRVVESTDLADYDYSGFQMGQGPTMTGFKGEQAFTAAILELAESRKPKVLFTSGHGELEIDDFSAGGLSQARDLLGRDNVEVETWASLGQPRVPEGTDLVVIAGPTARFAESEAAALGEYLDAGGRLMLLVDPTLSDAGAIAGTGLEQLLAEYGVALGADIVVDPSNPLPFYGAETIFVSGYGDHPITRSLDQAQVPVIMPLVRSVSRAEEVAGLEVVELLRTSGEGWGEVDLVNLRQVEKGDADLAGPVPVAVAIAATADGEDEAEADAFVEGEDLEPQTDAAAVPEANDDPGAATRLVVFGDSDFATNGQLLNVGNAEILANSINWLVERETLIGIPPKAPEQVRLNLSASQLRRLTWLVLGLLPALAIASGVGVYWRRRS